jgi:hypothetical protein
MAFDVENPAKHERRACRRELHPELCLAGIPRRRSAPRAVRLEAQEISDNPAAASNDAAGGVLVNERPTTGRGLRVNAERARSLELNPLAVRRFCDSGTEGGIDGDEKRVASVPIVGRGGVLIDSA